MQFASRRCQFKARCLVAYLPSIIKAREPTLSVHAKERDCKCEKPNRPSRQVHHPRSSRPGNRRPASLASSRHLFGLPHAERDISFPRFPRIPRSVSRWPLACFLQDHPPCLPSPAMSALASSTVTREASKTHLLSRPPICLIHHPTMHVHSPILIQPPLTQPLLIRTIIQRLNLDPPTLPLALSKDPIFVRTFLPVESTLLGCATDAAGGYLRDVDVGVVSIVNIFADSERDGCQAD